jgi:hypothetical protein
MGDSQKYHDEAARLRSKAEVVNDRDLRKQLLDIAAQYDRLAQSIEDRAKDPHSL